MQRGRTIPQTDMMNALLYEEPMHTLMSLTACKCCAVLCLDK